MSAAKQLYPELCEGLNEHEMKIFDTLTGEGKSPTQVRAGIRFIKNETTKEQVANKYDVSKDAVKSAAKQVYECKSYEVDPHITGEDTNRHGEYLMTNYNE